MNKLEILENWIIKEDRKCHCLKCNKIIPYVAYGVEKHYDKFHPEIDWRTDRDLLQFKLNNLHVNEIMRKIVELKSL